MATEPEKMMFDANLREFAFRTSTICGMEEDGKISQDQAYEQIKLLWRQLQRSKDGLRIEDGRASQ